MYNYIYESHLPLAIPLAISVAGMKTTLHYDLPALQNLSMKLSSPPNLPRLGTGQVRLRAQRVQGRNLVCALPVSRNVGNPLTQELLMGKYGRIIKQNGSCSSTPWDSFLEFSPRIVWFIINIAYKNMRSSYFIPEIDRNWMMNTSNQRWHSLYTRECSASTWLWIRN